MQAITVLGSHPQAAVLQMDEQLLDNQCVRFNAFDVDKTHTAGIVLVAWIIQHAQEAGNIAHLTAFRRLIFDCSETTHRNSTSWAIGRVHHNANRLQCEVNANALEARSVPKGLAGSVGQVRAGSFVCSVFQYGNNIVTGVFVNQQFAIFHIGIFTIPLHFSSLT